MNIEKNKFKCDSEDKIKFNIVLCKTQSRFNRDSRNHVIRSIATETSGEKSDADPPDYILNRKAKLISFTRDKFGFLFL